MEQARRAAKCTLSQEEWWMGARRTAKRTKSWEEWWRGPGGQPNALRAGRGGARVGHQL